MAGDFLRRLGRSLKKELSFYRRVIAHEQTPRVSRWLLAGALAYAISPIDLIPDWIPILGHLDDVVIVPLLVWLALRFIPESVLDDCRADGESPPVHEGM